MATDPRLGGGSLVYSGTVAKKPKKPPAPRPAFVDPRQVGGAPMRAIQYGSNTPPPPSTPAQPQAPLPTAQYTPGSLDAQALTDIANRNLIHQQRLNALAADRALQAAKYKADSTNIASDRARNLTTNEQGFAGRGLTRSGLKSKANAQVEANATNALTGLDLSNQSALNNYQRQEDEEQGGYLTDLANAQNAGAERDYQGWLQAHPVQAVGPDTTVPAPVQQAFMSYDQFRAAHGGRNDAALKAAYNKALRARGL